MKYSAIIPTMWKSRRIEILLRKLERSSFVNEIILIDNDPSARNVIIGEFEKIKYFPQEENIFVNPAWNLGVSESVFSNAIAILNDDITFDVDKIFKFISPHLDRVGLIGIDPKCYKLFKDSEKLQLFGINRMPGGGFGSAMFMKKDRYKEIPNDLKIWYGDNWLFAHQKKQNLVISGIHIATEMSSTVRTANKALIRQDAINYQKYHK